MHGYQFCSLQKGSGTNRVGRGQGELFHCLEFGSDSSTGCLYWRSKIFYQKPPGKHRWGLQVTVQNITARGKAEEMRTGKRVSELQAKDRKQPLPSIQTRGFRSKQTPNKHPTVCRLWTTRLHAMWFLQKQAVLLRCVQVLRYLEALIRLCRWFRKLGRKRSNA